MRLFLWGLRRIGSCLLLISCLLLGSCLALAFFFGFSLCSLSSLFKFIASLLSIVIPNMLYFIIYDKFAPTVWTFYFMFGRVDFHLRSAARAPDIYEFQLFLPSKISD